MSVHNVLVSFIELFHYYLISFPLPLYFMFTSIYIFITCLSIYIFTFVCFFFIWWSQWLLIYLLNKCIEVLCAKPPKYSSFFPFSKYGSQLLYNAILGFRFYKSFIYFRGKREKWGDLFMVLFLRFFWYFDFWNLKLTVHKYVFETLISRCSDAS